MTYLIVSLGYLRGLEELDFGGHLFESRKLNLFERLFFRSEEINNVGFEIVQTEPATIDKVEFG